MKKRLLAFAVLALLSVAQFALAQPAGQGNSNPPGGNAGGGGLTNPLQGGTNVETFLLGILDFVIRIGAIIVVLMLVLVGYKFVEAQGAPDKIREARGMLLWTVIGALILLGAKAIALGIQATVAALG